VLLTLNAGNTNISLGAYDGSTLLAHWRLASDPRRTADEYAVILLGLFEGRGLPARGVTGAAVCSVVPRLTPALVEACSGWFGCQPLVVGPDVRTGLRLAYEDPRELGPDRIANAVAAYEKYGGPVVVADLGTATTVDAVSAEGVFLGGAIAPGIGTSLDALYQRASRLHRIELAAPASAIGRSTAECLRSGVIFGFAGQVDALVRRMAAEMGAKPRVVATGGFCQLVGGASQTVELIEPFLTLEGIRIIFEGNARTPARAGPPAVEQE
jgi:type III pantothenate kinase